MRKNRKHARRIRTARVAIALVSAVLLVVLSIGMVNKKEKSSEKQVSDSQNNQKASGVAVETVSDIFLVSELESGKRINRKNEDRIMFPASLVKIMTAIIVLDSDVSLDDQTEISELMYSAMLTGNASKSGLPKGESIPIRDLLYGLLLPSGGDAALALAEYVAGGEEQFVELMNKKAKELELTSTHFTNTTGLHDDNMYTTAEDVTKLLRHALNNSDFYQIFTAREYKTSVRDEDGSPIVLTSTLSDLVKNIGEEQKMFLGGKTGTTDEAGLCLITLVEKNGQKYIILTAKAFGSNPLAHYQMDDTIKLLKTI